MSNGKGLLLILGLGAGAAALVAFSGKASAKPVDSEPHEAALGALLDGQLQGWLGSGQSTELTASTRAMLEQFAKQPPGFNRAAVAEYGFSPSALGSLAAVLWQLEGRAPELRAWAQAFRAFGLKAEADALENKAQGTAR